MEKVNITKNFKRLYTAINNEIDYLWENNYREFEFKFENGVKIIMSNQISLSYSSISALIEISYKDDNYSVGEEFDTNDEDYDVNSINKLELTYVLDADFFDPSDLDEFKIKNLLNIINVIYFLIDNKGVFDKKIIDLKKVYSESKKEDLVFNFDNLMNNKFLLETNEENIQAALDYFVLQNNSK